MKKLVKNILIFILITAACSLLLNRIIYPAISITPWSWGSSLIFQKEMKLQSDPGKYNTLFIGSSRVYRHINPSVIDSLVDPKLEMHSFNMGINWLFMPESFNVYQHLVNNEKLKFNYVIIELSKVPTMDFKNLHTSRTKYWYNFSYYKFIFNAVLASNISFGEKAGTLLVHTISYIDHLINLGFLTEALSFKADIAKADPSDLGKDGNGFLPFITETGLHADPNVKGRHQRLLSDTTTLSELLTLSREQSEYFEKNPGALNNYNRVYVAALNKMIADAKTKGIHLVFLFTPKLTRSQYKELLPVYAQIDPAHRISFSDGRKFPELYSVKYAFDLTHFNEAGANYYSKKVAEALDSLLIKK